LSSQLLAAEGPFDSNLVLSQKSGRLLIYNPWENVADGASQVSSLGFFDINDAPPWDTWIHYAEGRLVSWVPNELIKLAQDGIDANPVQCIQWADESAQ
jgi:ferredoxin